MGKAGKVPTSVLTGAVAVALTLAGCGSSSNARTTQSDSWYAGVECVQFMLSRGAGTTAPAVCLRPKIMDTSLLGTDDNEGEYRKGVAEGVCEAVDDGTYARPPAPYACE